MIDDFSKVDADTCILFFAVRNFALNSDPSCFINNRLPVF